jgi:hypothetical protein
MSYQNIIDLLNRQEQEKKELAAGVYEAWQPIGRRELLSPYEGDVAKAPPTIQEEVIKARQPFFAEWGSDGRLAAMMEARHAQQRDELSKRDVQTEKIRQLFRKGPNDRHDDRGR